MATEPLTRPIRRRRLLGAAGASLAAGRSRAAALPEISFARLYKSIGVRGLVFSDEVLALAGQSVAMRGYMAPPLKAESPFFVLTREPLTLCPFCQSDAEWPIDIVVVYLREAAPLLDGGARLSVLGRLEIGSWTDPDSGFVSLLRLTAASFRAG